MPKMAAQVSVAESANPSLRVYEGFSVDLQPAPIIKRILAYGTDLGIVGALVYGVVVIDLFFVGGATAIGKALSLLHERMVGSTLVLFSLIVLLVALMSIMDAYFIYFEFKKNGQTPGKKLFGLKVISLRSGPMTLGQVAFRDLFRYVDCGLFFPGLISVFASEKKQRLGDWASSTMVVHSTEREKRESFLYVNQADFHQLKEVLQPQPVSRSFCDSYLRFAY